MSIGYVGPAFTGDEKKHGSFFTSLLGAGATAGVGAAIGGFVKQGITPRQLADMPADSFTKTFEGVPNNLIDPIKKLLDIMHPDKIAEQIKAITNKDTMSVEKFLTSYFRNNEGNGPKITVATMKKDIEGAPEETKKLQSALAKAQEALGKVAEAGKANAQKAVEAARTALDEHLFNLKLIKNGLKTIESAKDNEIGLEALKKFNLNRYCLHLGEALKGLGKDIPKTFSGRNALIGGGIGLATFGIGKLLFGGHND